MGHLQRVKATDKGISLNVKDKEMNLGSPNILKTRIYNRRIKNYLKNRFLHF